MTRRQRIRLRSTIQKTILILAVLLILVGIGILAGHFLRSLFHKEPEPAVESTVFETPDVSPTPVPTPEPTPEPYADKPVVDLNDWSLKLANYWNPLPEDFAPELMEIENDQLFDARAGMHLLKLIEDARAAGFGVYVCSGFRSYETQHFIYWNHVENFEADGMTREEAEAATRISVNYPGCSEHQLGLSADLLEYQGQDMEPYIGGSGLMLWLEEHCADYGFIIRYPEGKTEITSVEYEPWHLRYVGSCARYIMKHDLCLEEFLALYMDDTAAVKLSPALEKKTTPTAAPAAPSGEAAAQNSEPDLTPGEAAAQTMGPDDVPGEAAVQTMGPDDVPEEAAAQTMGPDDVPEEAAAQTAEADAVPEDG